MMPALADLIATLPEPERRDMQALAAALPLSATPDAGPPVRFSILVPCYNHAPYIPAALDSLLAQSWPHWEAVLVNDGSTDGSGAILDAYAARDARFVVVHQANGGTARALNAARARARYDWIGWLSSDDLFLPHKLALHAAVIAADGGRHPFHFTASSLLKPEGVTPNPLPEPLAAGGRAALLTGLACNNYINGITTIVHRDLYAAGGPFDARWRYTQDFRMWAEFLYRATPTLYLPAVTALTRIGPMQTTQRGYFVSRAEVIAVMVEHLNRLTPETLLGADSARPEAVARAAAGFLAAALAGNAYLTRSGLARLYIDKAIGLGRLLPPGSPLLAEAAAPVLLAHVGDPRCAAAWEAFSAGIAAPRPPLPPSPVAVLRGLRRDPELQPPLAEGIDAFLAYHLAP